MKLFRWTCVCILGGLIVTSAATRAYADAWNKKTYVTISQSIEVPGAVLPPGKYVFKLVNSDSNRHIVQIMNDRENHVYATNLAIPKERMQPADKTVLTFYEMPGGAPEPIRSWFYPGDTIGQEFAYPKNRAMEISLAVKQDVPVLAESREPAVAPVAPVETTPESAVEPDNSADRSAAPTETTEPVPPPPVASEPQPEPEAAAEQPAPQEPAAPQPATADTTPAEPENAANGGQHRRHRPAGPELPRHSGFAPDGPAACREQIVAMRGQALLRRAQYTFWFAGALLCAICAGIYLEARYFQATENRRLEASLRLAGGLPHSQNLPRREPGSLVGRIEIPRLKLSAIVLEGSDSRTLRLGVGRIPQTADPGQTGNVVLSGHRDTFFRPLRGIRAGDRVTLTTPGGGYRYVVQWTEVVNPSDNSALLATPDRSLTMVTCYPFRYVGPAPQRFIVRARQMAGQPTP